MMEIDSDYDGFYTIPIVNGHEYQYGYVGGSSMYQASVSGHSMLYHYTEFTIDKAIEEEAENFFPLYEKAKDIYDWTTDLDDRY